MHAKPYCKNSNTHFLSSLQKPYKLHFWITSNFMTSFAKPMNKGKQMEVQLGGKDLQGIRRNWEEQQGLGEQGLSRGGCLEVFAPKTMRQIAKQIPILPIYNQIFPFSPPHFFHPFIPQLKRTRRQLHLISTIPRHLLHSFRPLKILQRPPLFNFLRNLLIIVFHKLIDIEF